MKILQFYKKIELGLLANVHGHPDEFLYESDISVKKFPIKVNSCLIRPNMLDIFRNCKSYGDIDKNILDANSKATSEWYDKLRKTITSVLSNIEIRQENTDQTKENDMTPKLENTLSSSKP